MKGFELAVCVWAWLPSVCGASTASGEPPKPTLGRGEQRDFLTTDSVKYPKLCKAQEFFNEENGLAVRDVKRVLCLDLNLGDGFEELIYSELERKLTETGLHFGSFLLSRCVSRLKEMDRFPELFSKYLTSAGFDEDVAVIFEKRANLSEEDQNRIRMVLNGVFRKPSISEEEKRVDFGKFYVLIKQLPRGYLLCNDSEIIAELIFYAYPDVLLSYASRGCLGPVAGFLRTMRKAEVPKEVKDGELANYGKDSSDLDDMYKDNETILSDLVSNNIYSDYHYFVQRVFLKDKQEGDVEED